MLKSIALASTPIARKTFSVKKDMCARIREVYVRLLVCAMERMQNVLEGNSKQIAHRAVTALVRATLEVFAMVRVTLVQQVRNVLVAISAMHHPDLVRGMVLATAIQ